ncbi:hypothetical protein BD414DRAFT_484557 [Trametes punicea]|nr:hypothetical protein BD414DRAFT_484557 [Trametes punicea]
MRCKYYVRRTRSQLRSQESREDEDAHTTSAYVPPKPTGRVCVSPVPIDRPPILRVIVEQTRRD